MPHTLPSDVNEPLFVHPVVHPEKATSPIGYTTGDVIPSSIDDSSPHGSRSHTPHKTHHLTQEEEMKRNILSQVRHAQDAHRAGQQDEIRRTSRSRSRARESGSKEGSRSNSLLRNEGGSGNNSRSGSRAREFIGKIFGGGSGNSSRNASREPSRERSTSQNRGDIINGGTTTDTHNHHHTTPKDVEAELHVKPIQTSF